MTLRLRQICLAANEKREAVDLLGRVFDLRPVHGSGDLSPYGLPKDGPMSEGGRSLLAQQGVENLLFAAGSDFVEILFPTQKDTSVTRYIEKRGGTGAGYMVILQDSDLTPYSSSAVQADVRIIHEARYPAFSDIQFHPKDVGGTLLSVSSNRPDNIAGGAWYPAGAAWQAMRPSSRVSAIVGIQIASAQPSDLAHRWAKLLCHSAISSAGEWQIQLDSASLRFSQAYDDEGFVGVDLQSIDSEAVVSSARNAGLDVRGDTIQCLGISWRLFA